MAPSAMPFPDKKSSRRVPGGVFFRIESRESHPAVTTSGRSGLVSLCFRLAARNRCWKVAGGGERCVCGYRWLAFSAGEDGEVRRACALSANVITFTAWVWPLVSGVFLYGPVTNTTALRATALRECH